MGAKSYWKHARYFCVWFLLGCISARRASPMYLSDVLLHILCGLSGVQGHFHSAHFVCVWVYTYHTHIVYILHLLERWEGGRRNKHAITRSPEHIVGIRDWSIWTINSYVPGCVLTEGRIRTWTPALPSGMLVSQTMSEMLYQTSASDPVHFFELLLASCFERYMFPLPYGLSLFIAFYKGSPAVFFSIDLNPAQSTLGLYCAAAWDLGSVIIAYTYMFSCCFLWHEYQRCLWCSSFVSSASIL